MIGSAKIYFIIFGLLTIVGGVIGYVKAGSTASIIAGAISGVALIVAAYLLPRNVALGLILAGRVNGDSQRDRCHYGDRRLDKKVAGQRAKNPAQDARFLSPSSGRRRADRN